MRVRHLKEDHRWWKLASQLHNEGRVSLWKRPLNEKKLYYVQHGYACLRESTGGDVCLYVEHITGFSKSSPIKEVAQSEHMLEGIKYNVYEFRTSNSLYQVRAVL